MPFIKELLMNVGAKIFYGIDDLGEDAARFSEAFNLILEKGMLSLVKKEIPPLNFYYGQKGRRFVYQYLDSLIEDRRNNDGRDFMSYLVKSTREDGSYFEQRGTDRPPVVPVLRRLRHDQRRALPFADAPGGESDAAGIAAGAVAAIGRRTK